MRRDDTGRNRGRREVTVNESLEAQEAQRGSEEKCLVRHSTSAVHQPVAQSASCLRPPPVNPAITPSVSLREEKKISPVGISRGGRRLGLKDAISSRAPLAGRVWAMLLDAGRVVLFCVCWVKVVRE